MSYELNQLIAAGDKGYMLVSHKLEGFEVFSILSWQGQGRGQVLHTFWSLEKARTQLYNILNPIKRGA